MESVLNHVKQFNNIDGIEVLVMQISVFMGGTKTMSITGIKL